MVIMKSRYKRNRIHIIRIISVIALIGLTYPLSVYLNSEKSHNHSLKSPDIPHSDYKLQVGGFSFQASREGKNRLSIHADKLTVRKAKLGHFRVSLFHDVLLENTFIRLYGFHQKKGEQKNISDDLNFSDVFSKSDISAFPVKRIASVIMEPVCLEFYEDHLLKAAISAGSATVRLKKRDVFFEKNVVLVSASEILTVKWLSFSFQNSIIKTDEDIVLNISEL